MLQFFRIQQGPGNGGKAATDSKAEFGAGTSGQRDRWAKAKARSEMRDISGAKGQDLGRQDTRETLKPGG